MLFYRNILFSTTPTLTRQGSYPLKLRISTKSCDFTAFFDVNGKIINDLSLYLFYFRSQSFFSLAVPTSSLSKDEKTQKSQKVALPGAKGTKLIPESPYRTMLTVEQKVSAFKETNLKLLSKGADNQLQAREPAANK